MRTHAITTLTGSWVLWDAVQFAAPADTRLASLQGRTLATGTEQIPVPAWSEVSLRAERP
jgi:hypothetical protein